MACTVNSHRLPGVTLGTVLGSVTHTGPSFTDATSMSTVAILLSKPVSFVTLYLNEPAEPLKLATGEKLTTPVVSSNDKVPFEVLSSTKANVIFSAGVFWSEAKLFKSIDVHGLQSSIIFKVVPCAIGD